MPHTDLGGDDYNVTNVQYTDPHICQKACQDDNRCKAWTYVVRPPTQGACCLKNKVPRPENKQTCTSGVIPGRGSPASLTNRQPHTDTLYLLPTDTHLSIRLFLDSIVAEAYWMDGRVAMTAQIAPVVGGSVAITASADGATLVNATAWNMTNIWTTKEAILASM